MHLMGCLIFAVLAIVVTFLAMLWSVVQMLLGGKGMSRFMKWGRSGRTSYGQASTESTEEKQHQHSHTKHEDSYTSYRGRPGKKKVFADDDGEYVDFEEIND